ncbi:MAG: insulinase family protein [Candidatus Eisenbacteria bacterium]|nr:insulinase family protein [Candidatus Eisenbacteria bacterium]
MKTVWHDLCLGGWILGALLASGADLAQAAGKKADARWGDPRKMQIPELRTIQTPTPERYTLENGMTIYLLEDHDFPVVDGRALLRVGSIYEPADKVGLASVTGEVMRTGGSTRMAGDQLDLRLEGIGASVEIGIGDVQGNAGVSALSENAAEAFGILADLLRRPAFPEEKLELAKKQEKTDIASRNDDPQGVVFREAAKLVFGQEHPYARTTEYATINAITRQDLVDFHAKYFHPDRVALTVYGDFQSAEMKKILAAAFGDWPRSTEPLPPPPEVKPSDVAGTYLVAKEDMTNSGVVLIQEGIRMDHPDYPALQVMNEVLGGGFSSRLFNEIRTKRGLAYATGSSIGAGMHHPRTLVAYAMTQADSTVRTLGYVKREVEKIRTAPVTPQELQMAKDGILNSLVFDFSSKGAVLNRMAEYEYYGYPSDFLQTYQKAVQGVTAAQVQDAAARVIRPGLGTLVVGNPEKFGHELAALGDVQTIDIAIPEEEAPIPPAVEADWKRGRELLAAAAKATGLTALNSLKDLSFEISGALTVQGQEIPVGFKSVRLFPDFEREEQKLPFGTVTLAVAGEESWMNSPQGTQDLSPEQLADKRREWSREYFGFLREHATLKAQALRQPGEVNGAPADVVYIHSDAVRGWKLYLDPKTHLIAKMEYKDRHPVDGGPATAEEYYTDWKPVSGLQWPHTRKIFLNGDLFGTMTTTSVQLNTGVDRSAFARPK